MSQLEGNAPAKGRVDALLADLFPELSRSRAAALIKDGRVRVDGEVVRRPSTKCISGAQILVEMPPLASAQAEPQDLPLDIVHEDADLIVVNKAPGMVVHPSAGHADGTLVNALLFHIKDLSGIGGVERPGIVHRIDRGTSGLLVVAKHDAAHQALAAQFAEKTAGRRYVALCYGVTKEDGGRIESTLARHPVDRKRFASSESGGKRAVTHWRRLAHAPQLTMVECRLETGRTHQIRVHLAEMHHPLVNDDMYGNRRRVGGPLLRWMDANPRRPLLHAWKLGLTHPTTGERLVCTAPLPQDFKDALVAANLPEEALPADLVS
ncbi:MAG: RluA family pseudouridine synthase [Proteobacteria bacterium]|nr:RluA family pseudouridine synthase [Pseudomonadota bacterium]